jgi:hypothetical protein
MSLVCIKQKCKQLIPVGDMVHGLCKKHLKEFKEKFKKMPKQESNGLTVEEISFLSESNAIEGICDSDSLDQAIYAWDYLKTIKPKEMKIGVVLKVHKILMLHQKLLPNEKGYFRRIPVWIGSREGIKWKMIDEAMKIWCYNAYLYPEHWQAHHVRFETIHPFVDGNGRVGRMLMNWERLNNKEEILIIEEGDRRAYYSWFPKL